MVLNTISRITVILIFSILVFSTNADAGHCKGKHKNDPDCSGDPGGGDPPVPADPKVVFRDSGVFVANADGTARTQIRVNDGAVPRLDADNSRVLLLNLLNLWQSDYVGLLVYDLANGNHVETTLVDIPDLISMGFSDPQNAHNFTSWGVSDMSPDGTKYSYSFYDYDDSGDPTYHVVVAPMLVSAPLTSHVEIFNSGLNGGLDFGAWDASGNYVFLVDQDQAGEQMDVLVIDVVTNPGSVVATIDLDEEIDAAGFNGLGSDPQDVSASAASGSYSLGPNSSLCLMVAVADWSVHPNPEYFTIIIDVPGVLDSEPGCSVATANPPILDFIGEDFTIGDAGLVGQDYGKNRVRGIWTYDFDSGSRTKIIDSGFRPDWDK